MKGLTVRRVGRNWTVMIAVMKVIKRGKREGKILAMKMKRTRLRREVKAEVKGVRTEAPGMIVTVHETVDSLCP